jgi:hypothetical protein
VKAADFESAVFAISPPGLCRLLPNDLTTASAI